MQEEKNQCQSVLSFLATQNSQEFITFQCEQKKDHKGLHFVHGDIGLYKENFPIMPHPFYITWEGDSMEIYNEVKSMTMLYELDVEKETAN